MSSTNRIFHLLPTFFISFILCLKGFAQSTATNVTLLRVIIVEAGTNEPLPYAVCTLKPDNEHPAYTTTANENGICLFRNLPKEKYRVCVFFMGQSFQQPDIVLEGHTEQTVKLNINYNPIHIGEVVVTASESKSLSTSSKINTDAIRHIQPSSIADLLELLPGGRSSDPDFSSPQSIRLREALPVGENYNTSSLGTQFLIDGIPMNNDANLQSTPTYSNYGSSFVNSGVDMRSLTTDDIESVEIIRGIPSVEYGDLTSGMVKIIRKHGGKNLNARFKADMTSKLLYAGKGFEWNSDNSWKANISLSYLDAKSDPRNTRQNYSRFTGSVRLNKEWNIDTNFHYSFEGNLDYSGSFDKVKSDKDIDNGTRPLEQYKSSYNRTAFSTTFRVVSRTHSFFRSVETFLSASMENSLIDRWKYVAMSNELPLSTHLTEGDYDVITLPTQYDATLKVEGKPFYAFAKTTISFALHKDDSEYTFKTGAEWNMSKNYGNGTVFDPTRPFNVDMNLRPRSFNSIPAVHQEALFIENNATMLLGSFRIKWMAGIRTQTLMNIGHNYVLQGKIYADPRLNVRANLPKLDVAGNEMHIAIGAGTGWHTKMPTMGQLFPEPIYYDITQLNYWPSDESKRRINVRVFKIDPTNYTLKAARNFKWEIRGDVEWKGFSLSVTYFQEDMKSGFRNGTEPVSMVYKNYDETAINHENLNGPPSLETIPYSNDTLLTTYSRTTNGSRTQKKGIEFTLSTPRIKPLLTKFTMNGAWFKTIYSNSLPGYYKPTMVINGEAYPYIGCYEDEDGYVREIFNTNFTADTQVPRMGLIFSSSFQCLWFTGSKNNWKNPYPTEFIDKNNVRHPFTENIASNTLLASLIREYNSTMFDYNRVPFSMNINLKVTKSLYQDRIALAVFVNKILNYTPSYRTRYGSLVRRESTPYFGMELNFKL